MDFFLVQVLTGLSSAAVLFLVASGLSLVFGVTRILNFAHGSLYMLGAYIAYTCTQYLNGETGLGFWGSVIAATIATGLIGTVIEIVIFRRIYHVPALFQLLATFGILLIVQDITLHVWGPEDLLGPQAPGLDGSIEILGEPYPTYDLLLIALAAAVLGGLWLFLHKTRFGVLIRAATEDREMVGNLGVNQKWLFTGVFFLGSCLAGLAGALQLPRESVSLSMDMNIIIEAFVVVVIGGLGSFWGAAIAAMIVGLVQAFGILIFPQITLVVVFLIMAIVLIFKPYGLFGTKEEETVERALISDTPLRPVCDKQKIGMAAIFAVLCALPLLTGSYGLVLMTEMIILSLFAASLHFIMGPGGLGSFGHALYFGLGAYAVALLTKYFALAMPLALIAAPLAAIAGGLLFGWFCVRSSGIYLAMLTFAFAQIVWAIAFQWYDVTGGDNGILGIWPPDWASNKIVFYQMTLCLCSLAFIILRHVIFSPFGYTLRAIRDNPKKAAAIGIKLQRFQWMGLSFAGAFAGLAGGLFAYSKGSVFPTTLDVNTSMDAFVMTLLGGLNTLSGPIVGSVIYTWLEAEISRATELWRAVLGLIILGIVIFFPKGLLGTIEQFYNKRKSAS